MIFLYYKIENQVVRRQAGVQRRRSEGLATAADQCGPEGHAVGHADHRRPAAPGGRSDSSARHLAIVLLPVDSAALHVLGVLQAGTLAGCRNTVGLGAILHPADAGLAGLQPASLAGVQRTAVDAPLDARSLVDLPLVDAVLACAKAVVEAAASATAARALANMGQLLELRTMKKKTVTSL